VKRGKEYKPRNSYIPEISSITGILIELTWEWWWWWCDMHRNGGGFLSHQTCCKDNAG